MKRDYLFHSFFLALFLFLLFQSARLFSPFLTPMLAAGVLLVLAYPFHHRLTRAFPRRSPSFHAALSTIGVTAAIVLPLIAVGWLLLSESQVMSPMLQQWRSALSSLRAGTPILSIPLVRVFEHRAGWLLGWGKVDFEQFVLDGGTELFNTIGHFARMLAAQTFLSIGSVGIMIFTLFFLFRDGQRIFSQVRRLIPMRAHHKDRVAAKLQLIVTETIRGAVLTALCQTVCAVIGYAIAGVPGALTLGVVTGLASFIPFVGTAMVWLPMGLFLVAQGSYARGAFVLSWGLAVVAVLDNILRTVLIGRKAHLPTFFLFFGIVGGVKLYGLKGFLIGPLLVAIIPIFIDIYRDQYLRTVEVDPLSIPEHVN